MLDQLYELRHLKDHLAPELRHLMLAELLWSLQHNKIYFSRNFVEERKREYPVLLQDALAEGTPDTLDDSLAASGIFKPGLARRSAQSFVWDEFNKYYMRALCQWVRGHPGHELTVARGRQSAMHRQLSDDRIGQTRDPLRLLNQLRTAPNINPFGANSGLTLIVRPSRSGE